ncbi:MAG: HD domain-containing protein [Thermodesulfobacteriota bacterium]
MKNLYVEAIRPGDPVDGVFALSEKTVSVKKDGGSYLTLRLSDATGQMKAVMWDNVDQVKGAFGADDYVFVKGRASEYRGELQVVVSAIGRVAPEQVDPADFLPATGKDVAKMMESLRTLAESVADPMVKELLAAFFEDPELAAEFPRAPAAKSMHHAYVGGLLEHTLSVTVLADMCSRHFAGLDRDLLLAGAVLHDVGKTRELSAKGKIDYTNAGRLLSHIVLGVRIADRLLGKVPGFPEEKAMLIRHMIVSHHGLREFGSPEPPKTLEALVLNLIDDLDAKVNGVRAFLAQSAEGDAWTAFHRLLERQFFKPNS